MSSGLPYSSSVILNNRVKQKQRRLTRKTDDAPHQVTQTVSLRIFFNVTPATN